MPAVPSTCVGCEHRGGDKAGLGMCRLLRVWSRRVGDDIPACDPDDHDDDGIDWTLPSN